ncbi:hypothetical protein B0O99DRAFT_632149 [Bisporella sp. PMI_857]|nr:hypothetical protein B0O99DRAFT_632149 [Bisporella sp. PMI_857]
MIDVNMSSYISKPALFNVKSVAIVGAGPSGLAVAKFLLAEEAFDHIDIYEQQAEIGGVWNYTSNIAGKTPVPQVSPHGPAESPTWPEGTTAPLFSNPMYDNLNTNIPKELMQYSDQDFLPESLSFPTREDVQDYLIKYSQDVRHLINFSTQVKDIRSVFKAGQNSWKLTSKFLVTKDEKTSTYDAVVIASGHYSMPYIPSVPGIKAFHTAFPSAITHSKTYRSSKAFKDKKVIVVGSGASGLDIGTQISKESQKPLLNSVRTPSPIKIGQENKEEVPLSIKVAEFLPEVQGVRFSDGRIENNIDDIIYCTGYFYTYPFLTSLLPPPITTGRRVQGLYKQLFSIHHPTLAFTALPQKVIPFPLSEVQGAAIAKVWSGKLWLPGVEEMQEEERRQVEERGDGTSYHMLGFPKDMEYINGMGEWVKTAKGREGKKIKPWGERMSWLRECYADARKKFVETGGSARSLEEIGFVYPGDEIEKPKL